VVLALAVRRNSAGICHGHVWLGGRGGPVLDPCVCRMVRRFWVLASDRQALPADARIPEDVPGCWTHFDRPGLLAAGTLGCPGHPWEQTLRPVGWSRFRPPSIVACVAFTGLHSLQGDDYEPLSTAIAHHSTLSRHAGLLAVVGPERAACRAAVESMEMDRRCAAKSMVCDPAQEIGVATERDSLSASI